MQPGGLGIRAQPGTLGQLAGRALQASLVKLARQELLDILV